MPSAFWRRFGTSCCVALAACADPSATDISPTDSPAGGAGGSSGEGGSGNGGASGGGGAGGSESCAYQSVAANLDAALFSISASSPDDLYACGARDASGPLFYHFDGAAWTRIDTSALDFDLWWMWDDGAGTIWAAGGHGEVARYDIASGSFSSEAVGDPALVFFGIWGSSPTDVWLVGTDPNLNVAGGIYHYDGTTWSLAATPTPTPSGTERGAFKVWGRSATDVYVVGTGALSMHWDGATWTDQDSPLFEGTTIFTVSGDASGTVAVGGQGNGAAQSWSADSATLTDITPAPTQLAPGFVGVFDHPSFDPVASTAAGSVWRFSGGAWAPDTCAPATTSGLHAVWVDDNGGIWAVGGDLSALDHGVIVYAGELTLPSIP